MGDRELREDAVVDPPADAPLSRLTSFSLSFNMISLASTLDARGPADAYARAMHL